MLRGPQWPFPYSICPALLNIGSLRFLWGWALSTVQREWADRVQSTSTRFSLYGEKLDTGGVGRGKDKRQKGWADRDGTDPTALKRTINLFFMLNQSVLFHEIVSDVSPLNFFFFSCPFANSRGRWHCTCRTLRQIISTIKQQINQTATVNDKHDWQWHLG